MGKNVRIGWVLSGWLLWGAAGSLAAEPSASVSPAAWERWLGELRRQEGYAGVRAAFWMCERGRHVVSSFDSDSNYLPASTLKVVTVASLSEQRPLDSRLKTRLQRTPDGDLVLSGGGDPELSSVQLQTLGRQVAPQLRSPVRVWVDSRAFVGDPYPAGWAWDDLQESYAPEIRATTVDQGRVRETANWLPEAMKSLLVRPSGLLIDVDVAAGWAIASGLKEGGIEVLQVQRLGEKDPTPASESLASCESRSLRELARHGLAVSDNLILECLHRLALQQPPTQLKGRKEFRLVDGSGLSRYNLISARALGEVLRDHPEVGQLLPAPGEEGTLRKRFLQTPLMGHLRAKTGTMSGVSGLVGEAKFGSRSFVFALLSNGWVGSSRPIKEAEERWLVSCLGGISWRFQESQVSSRHEDDLLPERIQQPGNLVASGRRKRVPARRDEPLWSRPLRR